MRRGEEKGERDKGRERKSPIRVARLRIRPMTRIIRVALAEGDAGRGSKGRGWGDGRRERRADEGGKSVAE